MIVTVHVQLMSAAQAVVGIRLRAITRQSSNAVILFFIEKLPRSFRFFVFYMSSHPASLRKKSRLSTAEKRGPCAPQRSGDTTSI